MTIKNARAVIWDMDGVIADTASYHEKAWRETFQKMGIKFTGEDFRRSFGQRNDTIIGEVLGEGTLQEEINTIAAEKEASYRQKARQHVEPLPGVVTLLSALGAAGFRQAVASSAPLENVRQIMSSLGIGGYFQSMVTEKDVTEGKPSPQGFLLASRKLGVTPQSCIVIEDAVVGVTAAKQAGMGCLAVTNTHSRNHLAGADLVVDSLEELTVADLEGLLGHSGVQS